MPSPLRCGPSPNRRSSGARGASGAWPARSSGPGWSASWTGDAHSGGSGGGGAAVRLPEEQVGGAVGASGPHQGGEIVGGDRFAEQVTLHLVAAPAGKKGELVGGLDA